jgi:hypothetical protein
MPAATATAAPTATAEANELRLARRQSEAMGATTVVYHQGRRSGQTAASYRLRTPSLPRMEET